MKKTTRLMAAALCVLLLAGCTMPSDVFPLIAEIGTVTLASGDAIAAAEARCDEMFPLFVQKVDNYSVLIEARNRYDLMVAANDELMAAADGVGEITLDSKESLDQLHRLYEKNTERYAPEEFTDFRTRLEDMDKQYRQCVLEDLYQEAQTLYDQHQYARAISVLEDMMKQADADTYADRSKALTEKCSLAIAQGVQDEAQALLDAGDPYGALRKLDNLVSEYRQLIDYTALRESALAALAKQRPGNGTVLERTTSTGTNVFKVTSQQTKDCCLKLESISNSRNYILVYIRAGKTASIKVPDGTYYIKQVSGDYWCDTENYFYPTNTYTQFDETARFSSTRTTYTQVTVTLGGVVGGNMGGDSIEANAF